MLTLVRPRPIIFSVLVIVKLVRESRCKKDPADELKLLYGIIEGTTDEIDGGWE